MTRRMIPLFLLIVSLGTTSDALGQPRDARIEVSAAAKARKDLEVLLPTVFQTQTFSTCGALVTAAQAEVFTLYTFEPAESVYDDVECADSPLFRFADGIHRRTRSHYRGMTAVERADMPYSGWLVPRTRRRLRDETRPPTTGLVDAVTSVSTR